MSLLISIQWKPSRSTVIRGCKARLAKNDYDACGAPYWSFGRQYMVTVLRNGIVQDSRMTFKRRIQRWMDARQRNELLDALNARLEAKDRQSI